MGRGIPILRHDWRIPTAAAATGPWIDTFFDGWLGTGIGSAQPYPTFYLIGFALRPFYGLGSAALTTLLIAVTVVLAARAAMFVARRLGATPWAQAGAGLFAALNPWVYSKYVAGHILMIFCYAVVLGLLAEVLRERPRTWALVLLAAFSVSQIEFFLIAGPMLALWASMRRRPRALAALAVAALPIAYGIAASYHAIRGTPFNLSWQRSQSLDLGQAALLQGYVFDYARAFGAVALASFALGFAALAGLVAGLRDARTRPVVAVAVLALLVSSGTRGPLGPAYEWAVAHVPEVGVYRELYDLVALVTIGYVVLLARGAGRTRWGGAGIAVAAAAFAGPWIAAPPDRFFVAGGSLPQAPFPAGSGARVALEPAFQPMQTTDGRGSGVDPDAFVRDGRATPIDECFPSFPVDSALGYAAFRGDDAYLEALGVGSVVDRPYLRTNLRTLRYQWIAMAPVVERGRSRALVPHALLAMSPGVPQLASIGNGPGEAAAFFGDAEPDRVRAFDAQRGTNDARAAWVDARLGFPTHPEWGNAYGGAATQSRLPLALPLPAVGTSVLAETDGDLAGDDGAVVATAATALHWYALRDGTRSLRCRGTCVVVLQARVPAGLPEHVPERDAAAVPIAFVRPWLARATIPAGPASTLRLNVRYDPAWRAVASGETLRHVRLDTALNAWVVPAHRAFAVTFVETTAAVQFALELIAAATIVALAGFGVREDYRARNAEKGGAARSLADTRTSPASGQTMASSGSSQRTAASRDGS